MNKDNYIGNTNSVDYIDYGIENVKSSILTTDIETKIKDTILSTIKSRIEGIDENGSILLLFNNSFTEYKPIPLFSPLVLNPI